MATDRAAAPASERPLPPLPEPAPDKSYSLNEENYYEFCDFLDMNLDDLEPGHTVYEGDTVRHVASEFLHGAVDTLLEKLGEQAWEEAGEFAEDWPEVPAAKKAELEALIAAWLDANVPTQFWTVKNVKPVEVTEALLAEWRGDGIVPLAPQEEQK